MTDKKEEKPADSKAEDKKDEKKDEEKEPTDKFYGKYRFLRSIDPIICMLELKKNLVLLEKASKEKDFKLTASLSKSLKKLRKLFNLGDIVLVVSYFLPDLFMRLQLPQEPTDVPDGVDIEKFLHCTAER